MKDRIEAAGHTDSNGIDEGHWENQDAFCVDEINLVYAVADGVGSHRASRLASSFAIDNVRKHATSVHGTASLEKLVLRVHSDLLSYMQVKGYQSAGTTLSIASAKPVTRARGKILAANVGDSPIILFRQAMAIPLFEDDSLRGQASKHVLKQCVGLERNVEVHTFEAEYSAGDLLLLCSDGVSDNLASEGNFDVLLDIARRTLDSKRIVDAAMKERKRMDDMTAVLVQL